MNAVKQWVIDWLKVIGVVLIGYFLAVIAFSFH